MDQTTVRKWRPVWYAIMGGALLWLLTNTGTGANVPEGWFTVMILTLLGLVLGETLTHRVQHFDDIRYWLLLLCTVGMTTVLYILFRMWMPTLLHWLTYMVVYVVSDILVLMLFESMTRPHAVRPIAR